MNWVVLAALLLNLCGCAASGGAPGKNAIPAKTADRVVIQNSAHTLTLMSGDQVLKSYRVALGNSRRYEESRGRPRDVEGEYVIDSKNPHSRFHRALHISYPTAADRERARKLGGSPVASRSTLEVCLG